jgi:hypothetical protein
LVWTTVYHPNQQQHVRTMAMPPHWKQKAPRIKKKHRMNGQSKDDSISKVRFDGQRPHHHQQQQQQQSRNRPPKQQQQQQQKNQQQYIKTQKAMKKQMKQFHRQQAESMSPESLKDTQFVEQNPNSIPPSFLYPTASPYAFVAKVAIDDINDNGGAVDYHEGDGDDDHDHDHDSNETSSNDTIDIDPHEKFDSKQYDKISPLLLFSETFMTKNGKHQLYAQKKGIFRYFPPSSFVNHEVPNTGIPEVAILGMLLLLLLL